MTELMEALVAAREKGDKATSARLLGKIVTLRANAPKVRTPHVDGRLSPFATEEQANEFADRQAALAEEAADSPIMGFAPKPW